MKIKVISDGNWTQIVNAETGEQLHHVRKVTLVQEVGGLMTATLEIVNVAVDVVAEAKTKPPYREGEDFHGPNTRLIAKMDDVINRSSWLPTAANINALPEPVRKYIHEIEAKCDPAGDAQSIICLRDQVDQLSKELERLRETL